MTTPQAASDALEDFNLFIEKGLNEKSIYELSPAVIATIRALLTAAAQPACNTCVGYGAKEGCTECGKYKSPAQPAPDVGFYGRMAAIKSREVVKLNSENTELKNIIDEALFNGAINENGDFVTTATFAEKAKAVISTASQTAYIGIDMAREGSSDKTVAVIREGERVKMLPDWLCKFVLDNIDNKQPAAWQPIDTAPKDGAEILAFECPIIMVMRFNRNKWEQADAQNSEWDTDRQNPTHWMPLPPPPNDERGG